MKAIEYAMNSASVVTGGVYSNSNTVPKQTQAVRTSNSLRSTGAFDDPFDDNCGFIFFIFGN